MKPENKELLLKDLCARLPYWVKVKVSYHYEYEDGTFKKYNEIKYFDAEILDLLISGDRSLDDVKPYLRPMSSMTEEEREELKELTAADIVTNTGFGYENLRGMCFGMMYLDCQEIIDWFNKKMFDFRGLIPKDLAEIAPEGMYELKLLNNHLSSQSESDSVIDNTPKITVGCKIRSKTKPIVILSIISDDCHGDEFECSNGTVLSSKQIEKYYELIK